MNSVRESNKFPKNIHLRKANDIAMNNFRNDLSETDITQM